MAMYLLANISILRYCSTSNSSLFLSEGSPCNSPCNSPSANDHCLQQAGDLQLDEPPATGSQKKQNYVSQSAVALRCRVMPPPCIKNPYLSTGLSVDLDMFCDRKSRSIGEVSLDSATTRCPMLFILFLIFFLQPLLFPPIFVMKFALFEWEPCDYFQDLFLMMAYLPNLSESYSNHEVL